MTKLIDRDLPTFIIDNIGWFGYLPSEDIIRVSYIFGCKLTLQRIIRNINHEFLHRILLQIEGLEASRKMDNLKTNGHIRDMAIGYIEK